MKKLFRVKGQEAMLGGVAAGLSKYFDIDITLVRVLLVGAFFTPMPIVIMYLMLWIIMPAEYNHRLTTAASHENY